MGSKPKAPDMSAQNRAAEKQTEVLGKEEAEAKREKETLAMENTEKLRSIRRRGQGRSSLITTSETGVESKGYSTARSSEIDRIKGEAKVQKEKAKVQKEKDDKAKNLKQQQTDAYNTYKNWK